MLPPSTTHGADQPMGEDSSALRVESTTWNRDSHELFDYESRHVFTRQFLLRRASRVFRAVLDVSVVADGGELPTNADYLLSIRARDGRYFVYPADRSACLGGQNLQPRKLWLITKYLRGGTFPLSEGDVIKLGRFKLRVKQLVAETSLAAPVDFKLDDVEVPASDLTPEESQNLQCRICLLEGGNDEDPLVRACQCKGSIMYIHLACLQHWVNGRLNLNEDPTRSCCFVRQLQCELCKSPFPSSVVNRGTRFNVVKVPNVQPPFIVLENLVGPTNRGVHLCSMAVKKECKLGRGHESDVRIADVSISRYHAMIRYQDGNFLLEDHASKFGTLVALRRPTQIEKADTLAVQVGRTVLQFSIEDIPVAWLSDDVVEMQDKKEAVAPAFGEDQAPWGGAAEGGVEQAAEAPPPAGSISRPVEDVLRAFFPSSQGLTAQGTPVPARFGSGALVQGRSPTAEGGEHLPYFVFPRQSQNPASSTDTREVPPASSLPSGDFQVADQQRHLLLSALAVQFDLLQRQAAQAPPPPADEEEDSF